jgi:hypothetical protein
VELQSISRNSQLAVQNPAELVSEFGDRSLNVMSAAALIAMLAAILLTAVLYSGSLLDGNEVKAYPKQQKGTPYHHGGGWDMKPGQYALL